MTHHGQHDAEAAHDMHDMHGGQHAGHDGMMTTMRRRFFFCLILSIPVLLLSPIMGWQLNFGGIHLPIQFSGSEWVSLAFATVIVIVGGWPFLQGAADELKQRRPAMMALISLGILVAYGYSLIVAVIPNQQHAMSFLFELVTLIDIMLLGHWLEMRAVMRAGAATEALAALLPQEVLVIMPHGEHLMPIAEVASGSHIRVRAGERVPLDGEILSGESELDEALVTGESKPVRRRQGDRVIGGSQNGNGTLEVKVTADRDHGFLAQVDTMVASAQQTKSRAENLADRVAGWLFYAALFVAMVTLVVWAPQRGMGPAVMMATTVLVIACPHALGLAIPLVISRATALSAKAGLLVRDRNAYAAGKRARYVLMDKTGTLTAGQFAVRAVVPMAEDSADQVLALAAGLEVGSHHPIATGIMGAVKEQGIAPLSVTAIQTVPGVGLTGQLAEHNVAIITAASARKQQLTFDEAAYRTQISAGYTTSLVVRDQAVIGLIALGDTIKPDALAAVKALRHQGYIPVMITGDNEAAAQVVAQQLGISEVAAGLLPDDKVSQIKRYQQKGAVVMVGDGINDAPSLAQADLGIAIGAGTDVALAAADVVLAAPQLMAIVRFLTLARQTSRKMTENLWWGAGYNLLALPLAAGILAPWNVTLSPAFGGVLMTLSTIVVAINAMLLRGPEKDTRH